MGLPFELNVSGLIEFNDPAIVTGRDDVRPVGCVLNISAGRIRDFRAPDALPLIKIEAFHGAPIVDAH